MKIPHIVGAIALTLGLVACATPAGPLSTTQAIAQPRAVSDSTRLQLESLIQNVSGAQAKRYNATDSASHTMDCLKIIPNPNVAGQFLGVYHCYFNGGSTAYVCLATSTDLLNWTFVRTLAGASGSNATQPTIIAVGTGFMVAWEQEPNNHVKLAYFTSWANLQANTVSKSMDLPRQLSTYAEGTPSFYSATATSADIGFHYYQNGTVDRQARGQMANWSTWTSSAQTAIDNAMLYYGVGGNIGDRDTVVSQGYSFNIQEAGGNNSDFGSWRVFLYDAQTGNADKLSIQTDGGSKAFANPTATLTTLGSQTVLVCTLFVPTENSAAGEKGELIYYSPVSSAWDRLYEAEASPMLHAIGKADGTGWSASTGTDAAGYLLYGPDATDIPTGNRGAIFKITEDNNTANSDQVATLDVYDTTSGTVLGTRSLLRTDFLSANHPDVFRVNFTNPSAHKVEFRINWTKKAYLNVDNVVVN